MAWVAVAVGGASLIGGILGNNASQNAAKAQEDAANQSTALQGNEFNTINSEYAPYRNAGIAAIGQLQNELPGLTSPFSMNDFYNNDPGFKFQLQQGQQALQRSAAARGLLNSTGTMRDMDTYTQGLANQDYNQALQNYMAQNQQRYGMLSGVVNQGMGAANNTSQAGMNYANNASNNLASIANAQGAAQVGTANAFSGALGNIGMMYAMNPKAF